MRAGLTAAVLCALAIPGLAHGADAKQVRSLLEMREAQVVRQHWDLSCGAAAIATLLTYQLGRPVSEREAALGMLRGGDVRLVRARLGFSLLDMKRLAVGYGFAAEAYGGLSLDELVAMAPVVAPIRVFGFGHFVVVRGRQGDRLLIADPAFGNRTMTVQAFASAWSSGVGFAVLPPGQPHPPNRMGAPAELFLTPAPAALRSAEAGVRNLERLR